MNQKIVKQDIVSCYDNLAYAGKFPDGTYLHKTFEAIINRELPSNRLLKILDAGGGAGYFGLSLAKSGHDVTVLDLSLESLKIAQKRSLEINRSIKAIAGDVENLPFPNEYFEAIVCIFVFSHLDNPIKAMSELKRVLRKSGRIIITFENKYWHIIAESLVENYANALSLLNVEIPIIKAYGILPPVRLYSVSEIKKLISDQDMRLVFFNGVRYLTGLQEHLKNIGTTDAEKLLHNSQDALELENQLMKSDDLLPMARHFIVCCEKNGENL
jgi:ubiquinone/menaquinone biosynthesis C-methylase UbiE